MHYSIARILVLVKLHALMFHDAMFAPVAAGFLLTQLASLAAKLSPFEISARKVSALFHPFSSAFSDRGC